MGWGPEGLGRAGMDRSGRGRSGCPGAVTQPSPHPFPRVQVRKYGEQNKLFISPGLLPDVPSRLGLPKPESVPGESGQATPAGRPTSPLSRS